MKKDILFPTVKGVYIAIARGEQHTEESSLWQVILINENDYALESVTISSRGYGQLEDKEVETSVLRHFFPGVESKSYQVIELIDPAVFNINNEYWVSYFVNSQMYDKKFIFLPESIIKNNMTYIPILDKEGILHS
ncbi:MAG TPA: hypothetical protein VK750_08260 [Cytophagaceae bacterium]|jgi:hypothetical protein|nr:hypothetical protein [Cytophagaceae bacterium]